MNTSSDAGWEIPAYAGMTGWGQDTTPWGHDTMGWRQDTTRWETGHDAMGDRNGSRSAQNERGRHGQNVPKQPLRSVMQLSSYHYSRGPIRHSRVGGNPSNLAPDMRTHADDDATNRAAAQIWKKGGRGCRVVAERRT